MENYPIWDRRNPDEQTILKKTELYPTLLRNYNEPVENIRLDNLWAKFKRYDTINGLTEQRIKGSSTNLQKQPTLVKGSHPPTSDDKKNVTGIKASAGHQACGVEAKPTHTGCGLTGIQKDDIAMADDPRAENSERSCKLNPQFQWMGTEFKRLRESVDGKNPKPVVVALLDSGVNINHPDLQGLVRNSVNFIAGAPDATGNPTEDPAEAADLTQDSLGHGTFCAGIIAQYAGLKNVGILNYKVIRQNNTVNPSDVLRTLTHIDNNPGLGVDIVHMAFGFMQNNAEVSKTLANLGEEKVLIAAAGNDGQQRPDTLLSPAKHGSVIAVGACDKHGDRAGLSAVGKKLDCLFRGEGIQSCCSRYSITGNGVESDRYITADGTSFAAPHCAALVALILACVETQFPNHGPEWRRRLTTSGNMRDLIARFCTAPTAERGYGIPNLRDVTEEMIKHHLKQTSDATDPPLD